MSEQMNGIESLFREHFPRKYLELAFREIISAYAHAPRLAQQNYEMPEATNLTGLMRRGLIEQGMRRIARAFDGKLSGTPVLGKGGWYHTLIVAGERVALTESTVRDPEQPVKYSIFREQYAVDNRQLFLFESREPRKIKGKVLYGIVLHRREETDRGKPGFAIIRFPMSDLTGYYPTAIDLFREFPDVVAELLSSTPPIDPAKPEDIGDLDIDFLGEDEVG